MKPNWPHKLSDQITFWYTLSYAATLFFAFGFLYFFIGLILDYRLNEDLLEDVEELRIYYYEFGFDRLKAEVARESESSDEEQFFITLLDRQGKIVFSSDLSSWPHMDTEQNTSSASEFEVLQTIQFPAKEFSTHTVFANLGADLFLYIGD